jgi:CubicO group peptidase (beta-lactamase class C family)
MHEWYASEFNVRIVMMDLASLYSKSTRLLLILTLLVLSGCIDTGSTKVIDATTSKVAVYNDIKEGEALTQWAVLDPIAAAEGNRGLPMAFSNENLKPEQLWQSLEQGSVSILNKTFSWQLAQSDQDVFNFGNIFEQTEKVFTYSAAKIELTEAKEVFLAVASDDAVKVWLNGELVHSNLVFRSLHEGADIVPVLFKKGENQLIVKVLNTWGDWSMSVKAISKQQANQLFADSALRMSVESIAKALKHGVDINAKNELGLTALHIAQRNRQFIRTRQYLEMGADSSISLPESNKVLDDYFNNGIDSESAGMSYLVAKDGNVIYQGAIGKADVKNNIDLTTKSQFRIGSITKQFTAVAILKLQEQGLLSIDDTLSKYIPDFPKGKEITLRHLLNHTSGIHSYTFDEDFEKNSTKSIEQKDRVNEIKSFKFDFEPGAAWSYNNSGYYLLGYIVEQVSKQSLGDHWRETLFKPLGMHNTGVYSNGEDYKNEALGYSKIEGETKRALDWDMTQAGAAGNLYSTVEDLFLWNEALFNAKVLSPESFKLATTPAKLANGEASQGFGGGYGLGVMLRTVNGKQTVSHGGGLPGFSSYLGRMVQDNLTVVTLSNSLPSNLSFSGDVFNNVAAIVLGSEAIPSVKNEPYAAPASLEIYTGTYDLAYTVHHILVENNRLYIEMGQLTLELFHSHGDTFYLKPLPMELTFKRDSAGKVAAMEQIQNGEVTSANRTVQTEIADIDPKEYERLLGDYKLNTRMNIVITKEDDLLYAQATGQGRFEIVPMSKLEYRGKSVKLRMVFNPSAEGEQIESFTLYQGGVVISAHKL